MKLKIWRNIADIAEWSKLESFFSAGKRCQRCYITQHERRLSWYYAMRKQHVLFCTLSFSHTVTRRAARSSTEAKTTVTCFVKRLVLTLRRFNYGKRWHEIRVLDRCSTWEPSESEKKWCHAMNREKNSLLKQVVHEGLASRDYK